MLKLTNVFVFPNILQLKSYSNNYNKYNFNLIKMKNICNKYKKIKKKKN